MAFCWNFVYFTLPETVFLVEQGGAKKKGLEISLVLNQWPLDVIHDKEYC